MLLTSNKVVYSYHTLLTPQQYLPYVHQSARCLTANYKKMKKQQCVKFFINSLTLCLIPVKNRVRNPNTFSKTKI